MNKSFATIIFFLSTAVAFAFPPLIPYSYGNFSFMIPQGWTVTADETQSSIFVSENPNDPSASNLAFIIAPNPNNQVTPDVIMQSLYSQPDFQAYNITELGREYLDNGALWVVAQLNDGAEVAYLTAVSFADPVNSVVTVSFFLALAERFVALDGATLPFVTFGGIDPSQFEQSYATNSAINSVPTTVGGFPSLVPYQDSVKLPQGWQVDYDPSQELLMVQENPQDPNGAILMSTSGPVQAGVTAEMIAQQTLQSTGFTNINIVEQEWLPELSYQVFRIVATAMAEGTPAKLAVMVFFPDPSTANINMYLATNERFDSLGGADLLLVTFAGFEPYQLSSDAGYTADTPSSLTNIDPNDPQALLDYQAEMQNQQQYYETMSNMLQMQHETSMTIINNMGSDDWCWADSYGTCY